MLASMLSATVLYATPAAAAGGAYTLNFAAADPSLYLPPIPYPAALTAPSGRGDGSALIPFADFNDGASDVKVESLAPQDMALGQIVPFFVQIDVGGDVTPENGEISFLLGWNTLTTNSGDFGYDARPDDIMYEVIGAFVDTSDGSHVDGGTDATVTGYSSAVVNDEIVGAVTVSGLDDGDTVVVEMWLVLDDTIPPGIGGNVQSRLIDAATGSDAGYSVANSGAITLDNGDSISTGNQTVPLLKPSDFFTADVDLSITKADDVDPIAQGGALTYTITATNTGPSVANSVVVYDELDPNVSFVSASDGGFLNTDTGDAIPDGAVQWDVGALAPGATVQFTVSVTVNGDAPTDSPTDEDLVNTVTITTISTDTDPTNNTDTEPTNVLSSLQPPAIDLTKTANPTSLDEPGGSVTFTVEITNTGDAGTIDSLVDDIHGDLATSCLDGDGAALVGQSIDSGQTLTCTFTADVIGMGGYSETDTVTAVVSNGAGSSEASDNATVTIADVPSSIEVIKTASPTSVPEPGGDVTFTFTVANTSAADSVTINLLEDSIYGDLNGQGDCSTPQTIAAGDSYSCSLTAAVTGASGTSLINTLNVTGVDDDGNPVGGTDDATVDINDVPSAIIATKTANPTSVPETGGDVTYAFTVSNDSAVDSVTIDTLTDSIYGDLNGQGDCSVPQTIAAGDSYSCSIAVNVSGNADDMITNVLTASGADDDGNPVSATDDAVVTVTDVAAAIEIVKTANPTSVDEPGGDVTFSFDVTNLSTVDTVTIDSLIDSIYGDLTAVAGSTCITPLEIGPGGTASCSFTAFVAGNADDVETNVVTASGTDDDGQPVSDTDDATVTIDDVPSSILVTKTADPTSVPETGGDVMYTIVVENTSAVDTVTVNSVIDDRYGDVSASCTPALPADLAPGETINCSFTEFLSGDTGSTHTNVATASGVDDDGNPVSDGDDETVTFDDVDASIEIIKTASPPSVDEPGGQVTFNFVINNTSPVDLVTIESLADTVYGDLNGRGDCAVPQILGVGESYSCSFTTLVAGNAGFTETNVVTATGTDDDGETVSDDDDATVTIADVPSSIEVTKTASPTTSPETGADVTFTVVVENTSAVDDVTVNSVSDSVYGDVSAGCDPALPATLAPGETVTCTFTRFVSGDFPGSHVNVATATGTDDDGNPVSDDDQEEVPFEDVRPDITVTKTADPTSVPETGGDVTFTFVVSNNSPEAATLDSLIDSDFGDLATKGTCATPQSLAPAGEAGDSYTCAITVFLSGDASGPDHENTVTASASDDDGNSTTDTDDETVVFDDVLPEVSITKTANPTEVPETGADVTFTIVVTNNSLEDATIDSLTDSDFDLAAQCADAVTTVLASGASYTCTFTEFISGDASGPAHQNTATVVVSDGDGNTDTESDDETVTFSDVPPTIEVTKTADPTSVPETGGVVEFTITLKNTSHESVTITELVDTDYDLAAECADAVGTELAPGATYTCTFSDTLSGDAGGPAHENTVTGTAVDNDDSPATDDDSATVSYDDVLPDISVVKTASPTSVPETGGDVTFTVAVTNDGLEAVTLDSLVDDVYGPLTGVGDCATGATIAGGDTYSCSFTETVSGDFGGPDHVNTVAASASDNDGNSDEADDDATVTFTDVLPDVSITKTADPTSVDEPGGDVTFTLAVTNNSLEDVTIDSLTDSDFETELAAVGACDDAVGTVLASQETYSCSFNAFVAGNPADGDHENTATVVGSDDDGNSDTASDTETVTINNIAPSIAVTKSPSQDEVFAPGEDVTFAIAVENTSVASDPVTLNSIVDSEFGDVSDECELPQTIGSGSTFECDITRPITADHTNTVVVEGADDDGTEVSGEASASVEYSNPSISIEKSTNGFDADTGPGPKTLVGSDVTWSYVVTNDGDVTMSNISVSDDQGVDVTCATDTLGAGESTTCTASATSVAGQYANIGSVTASYTDADGDVATRSDEDPSNYFGAVPSVSITKTFADDSVIAGGAGSSFTLEVTNDGNVDLTGVSISDTVDDRLTVTGVSGTAGADNDSDGDAQTVEWLIANLGSGESVTITVNFEVASDVEEADGTGGLNDGPTVSNTATVSNTYTDDSGNTFELSEEATDTIDVKVDINLSIVKKFDPTSVPQGTVQSFTLVVNNSGPSDAVDVSVTDMVDDSIAVTGATVTSGTGDCSATVGQDVDCTVQIPTGTSVTIAVDYVAAPFVDGSSNNLGGDDFRFVFVNGSVLEGSTATGEVFLDGVDISADVTIVSSLTRNDIVFDPPGDDPAFELHLSCSDPFTGGWGQSGGPVEGVDVNWQIAYFSIARFNNNAFIKSCGNVTNPFEVPNSTTATGEDSFGPETASDTATLTIEPGITLDRLQTNGKRLTVRLTNFTGEARTIEDISVEWPSSNGNLTKVRLDEPTVWQGSVSSSPAVLDASIDGWNGGTLLSGEAILRFDFTKKSADSGYTIRLNFDDGTFLDINR